MPYIAKRRAIAGIVLRRHSPAHTIPGGGCHRGGERFWADSTAKRWTHARGFLATGISGTVLKRWLPAPAGLGLSGTMAYLSAGGT